MRFVVHPSHKLETTCVLHGSERNINLTHVKIFKNNSLDCKLEHSSHTLKQIPQATTRHKHTEADPAGSIRIHYHVEARGLFYLPAHSSS